MNHGRPIKIAPTLPRLFWTLIAFLYQLICNYYWTFERRYPCLNLKIANEQNEFCSNAQNPQTKGQNSSVVSDGCDNLRKNRRITAPKKDLENRKKGLANRPGLTYTNLVSNGKRWQTKTQKRTLFEILIRIPLSPRTVITRSSSELFLEKELVGN